MKAILVFNSVNDLLFSKWDDEFIEKMKLLGKLENQENITEKNNVSQLLAPIITSQRVMAAQFGNTYSSIKCKDKTTIVFDELLDHVFMIMSEDTVVDAQREIMDCKTFVQHICGQNINLLNSSVYREWLCLLLECRTKGDSIPGANGVIGESGATAAALNALKTVSKELKSPHQHFHLLLYVGDKVLALYSSRGSVDLSAPDLILLSVQCIAAQEYWNDHEKPDGADEIEVVWLPWLSKENSAIVNLCAGTTHNPCAPHSMHLVQVAPRVTFVVIVDLDLRDVAVAVQMSNQILSNLRRLLLQGNLDLLPTTLDLLEASVKKTTEALRKSKLSSALCARVASRMQELRKSMATTTPLTPETAAAAMHTALEATNDHLKPDIPSLKLAPSVKGLKTLLAPYVDFLRVKAMRYFNMGSGDMEASCSLTLHKYLEEFPGLIHFVFVDRTAGRFLAPDMVDCIDMLSPEMVQQTLKRTLDVVREGYYATTWRRGALHVCGVTWWERRGAAAPSPKLPYPAAVRTLPPPGDILGTFYRQLAEMAFPNNTQGVSLKELICLHLGLLPAATAVQQARRLAHSVHELIGANPPPAADLL